MAKPKILVTGACGQIGTILVKNLRELYGDDNVIASDIRTTGTYDGPYEQLDVTDSNKLFYLISKYQIDQIYHLAAILSAKGEANPVFTWNINMNGLLNILEAARNYDLDKVFYPSTIAVFGQLTPRVNTPQHPNITPETVYGISKAAGENWCQYYHKRYNVDVRSVRYPGIISWETLPGGGTTDYAVDIYLKAVADGKYTCYLDKDTRLPMMYMPDAIKATLEIMDAPKENIKVRTSYNIGAMDFTPAEIAAEISKTIPNFKIDYQPDFRQAIAASWPESVNDDAARIDWGWTPKYDLKMMTDDILKNLGK